jgi:sulfate adenylyltransferase/3'-phosphoadenosine 5'-phosphosulfate synthase
LAEQGFTIWFTGLSGAGKSTLALRLEMVLTGRGRKVEILDGDVVRTNLSKGLGFSKEDRDTNILRIAFVAGLLSRNGVVAITAAISPYRDIREQARQQIGDFVEVYVRCSINELSRRDVKGLYARALRGEIANFTGVSDPYEEPLNSAVIVDSETETVEESLAKIVGRLEELGFLETPAYPAVRATLACPPTENGLIAPHGGTLVNRFAPAPEGWQDEDYKPIQLNARTAADLELISNGAFSPLTGFMGQADYLGVVNGLHLANGLPWSIPVVLPVSRAEAANLTPGQTVLLVLPDGTPTGFLKLEEKYEYNRAMEAHQVYGTTEQAHPGVAALYNQGDILLSGPVTVFHRAAPSELYAPYYRDPAQTRRSFAEKGWRRVVAFQTRNPVHRAHEYIQKTALEIVDGLLLHPLVGETKSDDIPAEVRLRCYETLLEEYYPADRVLLSLYPAFMRYAGPREAIFHALVRKNYGCSHIVIGRDHAGVGNYYGPYAAQQIFQQFSPEELGITPLFFENSFFCRKCGNMASAKTCPHPDGDHLNLSGTKVRAMLAAGEYPPAEFSRPEVAAVLVEAYRPKVAVS